VATNALAYPSTRKKSFIISSPSFSRIDSQLEITELFQIKSNDQKIEISKKMGKNWSRQYDARLLFKIDKNTSFKLDHWPLLTKLMFASKARRVPLGDSL
jgi:hypothetical protein